MSLRFARSFTVLFVAVFVALAPHPLPAATVCEWDGIERIVAIGDVHGAYDRLLHLLQVGGIARAWTLARISVTCGAKVSGS